MIYCKADHAQPWFDAAKRRGLSHLSCLAGLGSAGGNRRLDAVSSAPSTIAALAHKSTEGSELWLANLTPETQKVKLTGLEGAAEIHRLSDTNFQKLATVPDLLWRAGDMAKKLSSVELGPYGVVRIRTA